MMKTKNFQIFLWGITIILLGMIWILPQTVPMHWNLEGEVDRYASRYACIILALAPMMIYYVMTLTRKIDPHQEKIAKRIITYEFMKKLIVIVFIALDIFYYYMVLVEDNHVQTGICLIIGLFMLMIGNYMPKVPQNFFVGIRTPWTLKNEIVWKKTHKVGGYAFIILGFITIISAFLGETGFFVIIAVSLLVVIFVSVYSYFIYKKVA